MKTVVLGLAALLILVGFEKTAQAQTKTKLEKGSAVDAGSSNSGMYYGLTNSFDPWGIAGIHPGYLGSGLSGYGPGATLNNQFLPWPGTNKPMSSNSGLTTKPVASKAVKAPVSRTSASKKPAIAKIPARTMP